MGVRGRDIIDDANAMFDYINKFNQKDIELSHIQREEERGRQKTLRKTG
jgi:hypothetical protein